MKRKLSMLLGLLLIFINGCSAFQDSQINCKDAVDWDGQEYLSCDIWIHKIINNRELGHSEPIDCETTDIKECCQSINEYIQLNKDNIKQFNNVTELKCKKSWW